MMRMQCVVQELVRYSIHRVKRTLWPIRSLVRVFLLHTLSVNPGKSNNLKYRLFFRWNAALFAFVHVHYVHTVKILKFHGKIHVIWRTVHFPLFLRASTCRLFFEVNMWLVYVNRQHSKIPL